ncbi:MAG: hypothetical protein IJ570_07435 [Prevotella sp.]|nr:hypothetical protein [Prevotella sp.]
MNINSIIENIQAGLASGRDGNIKLTEHSYLLDLLDGKNTTASEKDKFTCDVNWRDFRNHRFPVTWLMMTFITFILKCIVFACYWLASQVWVLFVGKKNKKDLSLSPRFNFVLFVAAITLFVSMIIVMLVFFISDILLFNPNTGSNDRGAIAMEQPCGEEHYLYLFNTATCWANTGIKVLKGDEVTVTASGSFYSKIGDMEKSAKNNDTLRYSRTYVSQNYHKDPISDSTINLCMYHEAEGKGENRGKARFGSLLVQVKDDYKEPAHSSSSGKIIQLDTIKDGKAPKFTVDSAGVLNFAVNDIYLSEEVLKSLIANYNDMNSVLQDSFGGKPDNMYSRIESKDLANHVESTDLGKLLEIGDSCKLDRFFCLAKKCPTIWFDDNVGEILLNITIVRNSPPSSIFTPMVFSKGYRSLSHFMASADFWNMSFYGLITILLWLILDYNVGHYINRKKLGKNNLSKKVNHD